MVNIAKTENPGFRVLQRRIAFLAVKNITVFLREMDSSRRVDSPRVSGRQNRMVGRGEIDPQSWSDFKMFEPAGHFQLRNQWILNRISRISMDFSFFLQL